MPRRSFATLPCDLVSKAGSSPCPRSTERAATSHRTAARRAPPEGRPPDGVRSPRDARRAPPAAGRPPRTVRCRTAARRRHPTAGHALPSRRPRPPAGRRAGEPVVPHGAAGRPCRSRIAARMLRPCDDGASPAAAERTQALARWAVPHHCGPPRPRTTTLPHAPSPTPHAPTSPPNAAPHAVPSRNRSSQALVARPLAGAPNSQSPPSPQHHRALVECAHCVHIIMCYTSGVWCVVGSG